jgi:hypothetical protein
MTKKTYDRDILALDSVELEQFVLDWVYSKKSKYLETTRLSGAGDLGRDVVGFLSEKKHEGAWHNYQCKQYAKPISVDLALLEVGKILYYAFMGKFTAPAAYFFVAPRGVNRNFEDLLFNPSRFKDKLTNEWDECCAEKIIKGQRITLDSSLEEFINGFNFAVIKRINLSDMLIDPSVAPVLFKWFGSDPGPAPKGAAPVAIQGGEMNYVTQLLEAYG